MQYALLKLVRDSKFKRDIPHTKREAIKKIQDVIAILMKDTHGSDGSYLYSVKQSDIVSELGLENAVADV